MIKYSVLNTDRGFDLIEETTKTVLELKYTNKKVAELCNLLNNGSGFDGWTPSFFSHKVKH